MIDKATVKKILDTADIVEVVGDYVNLTRRGANYMGLCPFHNERTPSFSVSPARGICHCFSCGKGGSPVNFIMEKEGINYHDALLHLARKYGIKVEERELSDEERAEQSKRESMLVVSEWAMKQFEDNLQSPDGQAIALSYLYGRGITQAAIAKFHLGYALDKGTDLYDKALRAGYDADSLIATGLCGLSSRDSRPYDRFRGRVIFPILSASGKTIAFGGRGIKGEAAKYINSPESFIYRKSNELYGIYQAKNAIVRQKKCYLVEGYMDVIGMWQSGMENTVASSGTSLTDGQIALIHRFTENVTLIYDGDSAGIKASLRGIDLLLSHKLDIKVLLLPDGDDPDSFSQKHTPEEFRNYIAEHEEDFIAFKTRILMSDSDAGTASGRAAAIHSIVTSIACVPDMIKRSLYIQETALRLNVSEKVLAIEVGKALEATNEALRKRRQVNRIEQERQNRELNQQLGAAASFMQQAPAETATLSPSSVDKRLTDSVSTPQSKVEKNLIEYIIKYGMIAFCEAEDNEHWLTVAEYVKTEIESDRMEFSTPLYKRIFKYVLSLTDEYRKEEQTKLSQIAERQKKEHEDWCMHLAEQGLSMSEIETKEQQFKDNQQDILVTEIGDFATDFIGHRLGSDPDDDIRRLALQTITPRYTLSKYHSKNSPVTPERERLSELVPRAIFEWKDSLLAGIFADTQKELAEASALRDMDKISLLIRKLQQISDIRKEVAKNIGERIITPR
ncbi:MAG: DNA primase [Prevotella sp.]|nr:DNA primase [Prevotella sp.]MCM1074299.1 DNA primase [Ruminococcus sp.]